MVVQRNLARIAVNRGKADEGVGPYHEISFSRNFTRSACFQVGESVDRKGWSKHFSLMSKKPRKIEESSTSYSAKKPAPSPSSPAAAPRSVDKATFRKVTDKIFSERKELLHKLAQ